MMLSNPLVMSYIPIWLAIYKCYEIPRCIL